MDITDRLYQKLEKMDLPPTESHNVKVLIRQALQAGIACNVPTDPLEGYSNLTAAIKAGEPIDWEELDGLKTQCVNPGIGTSRGVLKRDTGRVPERPWGWLDESMDEVYTLALIKAWYGEGEWALWLEGDIPLARKTADQLAPGTGFLGQWRSSDEPELMVLVEFLGERTYRRVKPMVSPAGYFRPEHVEVIEEYGIGTFQKPKGK